MQQQQLLFWRPQQQQQWPTSRLLSKRYLSSAPHALQFSIGIRPQHAVQLR
ncbi:MAG: hypothetical protein Tsb0027_00310 [Wenzhouxiangellaceae bacterium]